MKNIVQILEERGFLDAVTNEAIRQVVQQPLHVYCGFDPTSDSLHVGNLIPLMGLAWFQRCGHMPVAIVGGATGMIGDPSGKSTERQLLSEELINENLKGIRKNVESILEPGAKSLILNNLDWFGGLSMIHYLRDIGKYFRIGPMIAKESVRARMTSEEGMSYTEFSYQILQAYDFLHLYNTHGVTVQIGGSDQWGNITAGIELIRRVCGAEAQVFGMTFPLLTRSDGQKFGKSEKGSIWMSPEKLSPYDFYQYFVRVPDADVIRFMKLLTFMEIDEIYRIAESMQSEGYIPNTAQKRFAEEITHTVHGENGLQMALRATLGAAPGAKTVLDRSSLEELAADIGSVNISRKNFLGKKLIDILAENGIQKSKGDARRLIQNGGVYLNNEKVEDEALLVEDNLLVDGEFLLVSLGKKNKILIRIV